MIKTSESISHLIKNSKEYIENGIDLIKLEFAEKSSALLCGIFSVLVIGLFFLLALLFIGISIALLLSILTGSNVISFLIVAFLYAIIGIILWYKREILIRLPLMNVILSNLFKKD